MDRSRRRPPFPPVAVWVIAVVVIAALALAIGARLTGYDPAAEYDSPVADFVDVYILSLENEALGIALERDGPLLLTIEPGNTGFLTGMTTSHRRTRRMNDVPLDAPYRFQMTEDHRLMVVDPGTPLKLEAAAFGPATAGQLLRIYEAARSARDAQATPAGGRP
ncbi:hypothetical protein IHV25_00075 [Phaeovibrio sulfidiphilus]|uniref:Photosynthetic complex assembly protein n=1 Tax=Phaeovibrio sulfidiphilus TaxID=1220600 RepID=A0A8J6YMK0_9PROT|nr:photosynthetic complex assembly protein PuhC [Phaeovibrio sulfidiphilus]MBE1236056.1 hypothetical protein [Phaeovibrio sulfidiphilus]